MKNLMEELVIAVTKLSTHTFWDFTPIILSVIAVIVAVFVPIKIAKKQNKIAVFDKLYTAYMQFLLVRSFSKSIQSFVFSSDQDEVIKKRELFCIFFQTAFGCELDMHNNMSIGTASSALRKSETQMYMLPLLVSKNLEQKEVCSKKISAIYEPLYLLATDVIMPDLEKLSETDQNLKDFVSAADEFYREYADTIEAILMCEIK